ncbi:universal stress protein [Pseudomonas oryzihabitans]|uniref:universal stress protein n=1 Tax=Pseudomonas oryzihabitans TaxID=47885 RepID=UPI003F988A65
MRVAKSLLLSGLEGEILQVGDTTLGPAGRTEATVDLSRSCGSTVTTHLVAGHPEEAIPDRVHATRADLLVMGAYSHSAARRFLLGSQTSHMLRHTDITTLILRA